MVSQRVTVSVRQRLDTAAANVLRFALLSATRALKVDCRVELIGESLEVGSMTSPQTGEEDGFASRGDSPTY